MICLFGCSNLVYVTTELAGDSLNGSYEISVYKCSKCGKVHRKKETR